MPRKFKKMPGLLRLHRLASKCSRCGRCCAEIGDWALRMGIEPKDVTATRSGGHTSGDVHTRCVHLEWKDRGGKTVYSCKIHRQKGEMRLFMCRSPPVKIFSEGFACKTMLDLFERLPPMSDAEKKALAGKLMRLTPRASGKKGEGK